MPRPARTEKLHLRLSPDEKRKLRAAADAREQSLSTFVLDSALVAADEALLDRRRFVLSAERLRLAAGRRTGQAGPE
jgi:uncharacterized protein (DUF1778 family)